jgi:hypothetical protein
MFREARGIVIIKITSPGAFENVQLLKHCLEPSFIARGVA